MQNELMQKLKRRMTINGEKREDPLAQNEKTINKVSACIWY